MTYGADDGDWMLSIQWLIYVVSMLLYFVELHFGGWITFLECIWDLTGMGTKPDLILAWKIVWLDKKRRSMVFLMVLCDYYIVLNGLLNYWQFMIITSSDIFQKSTCSSYFIWA